MSTPSVLTHPRHSKVTLVVHASWATTCRARLLGPDFDEWVRRSAPAMVRWARVLAIGNSDEHVHVVLQCSATHTVAEIVGSLKGVLSHAWNLRGTSRIRWQNGYWAETCSPHDQRELLAYVRDQRERHDTGALISAFEPAAP